MRSLLDLIRSNQAAVERERSTLQARNAELSAILGIPVHEPADLGALRSHVESLKAAAASRIDPDDPEVQSKPILLSDLNNRRRLF